MENNDTVVYSPVSPIQNPVKLILEILYDIQKNRQLIIALFLRDLRAQYRQSFLGYFWLFAPPLLTVFVWMFLNQSKVIQIADSGMPYPIFVLIGTIFWQLLVAGVETPLRAFLGGKSVFMKLKVAPEVFILAGVARMLFDFLISVLLVIPVLAFYRISPPLAVILLPIVVLSACTTSIFFGLLAVPIGSLYSDVQNAIGLLMRFAMYFAPVVYPLATSGILGIAMTVNPFTPMLVCARGCLVTGELSGFMGCIAWLAIGSIGILFGAIVLRVCLPHLIARMGM